MAEERFKLRRGVEYLQLPLTQQATATAVTEGTETLAETRGGGGEGLIIYTDCDLIQCHACHHELRPSSSGDGTVCAATYLPV